MLRIPGHLRELGRGGRLHEPAGEAAGEADALAVDVGPGVLEQHERLGGVAEVDADLLEDDVGIFLDHRQVLLRENLEGLERSREVRDADGVGDCPGGLSRSAPAATAAADCLCHERLLCAASA